MLVIYHDIKTFMILMFYLMHNLSHGWSYVVDAEQPYRLKRGNKLGALRLTSDRLYNEDIRKCLCTSQNGDQTWPQYLRLLRTKLLQSSSEDVSIYWISFCLITLLPVRQSVTNNMLFDKHKKHFLYTYIFKVYFFHLST